MILGVRWFAGKKLKKCACERDTIISKSSSQSRMSQEYDRIIKQHEAVWASKDTSPCEKLDDFRTCVVKLKQERETYFVDPCPKNWPCLFACHRANIDKLLERLEPTNQKFVRECNIDMVKRICSNNENKDSPSVLTTQVPSCDNTKPADKYYVGKSYVDFIPLA